MVITEILRLDNNPLGGSLISELGNLRLLSKFTCSKFDVFLLRFS